MTDLRAEHSAWLQAQLRKQGLKDNPCVARFGAAGGESRCRDCRFLYPTEYHRSRYWVCHSRSEEGDRKRHAPDWPACDRFEEVDP